MRPKLGPLLAAPGPEGAAVEAGGFSSVDHRTCGFSGFQTRRLRASATAMRVPSGDHAIVRMAGAMLALGRGWRERLLDEGAGVSERVMGLVEASALFRSEGGSERRVGGTFVVIS